MTRRYLAYPAVALAVALAAPSALAQTKLEELMAIAGRYLPEEVGGRAFANALLKPEVGPQLSEGWELKTAFSALGDELSSSQPCPPPPAPNADPSVPGEECTFTRGDPVGAESASRLKLNLAEGMVRYGNRGRDPNPSGQPVAIKLDAARQAAVALAGKLGVPPREVASKLIRVRPLFVAGASPSEQRAEAPIRKQMGAQALIPRCMPVPSLERCVPVHGSSMRTLIATPEGLPAWVALSWPDFRMATMQKPTIMSRTAVLRAIGEELVRHNATAQTIGRLDIAVVYAQNRELSGQDANKHCATAEADEPGEVQSREALAAVQGPPADVQAGRAFTPAVLVYMVPPAVDEVDPTKTRSVSTGIAVFTIPLVRENPALCDGSV